MHRAIGLVDLGRPFLVVHLSAVFVLSSIKATPTDHWPFLFLAQSPPSRSPLRTSGALSSLDLAAATLEYDPLRVRVADAIFRNYNVPAHSIARGSSPLMLTPNSSGILSLLIAL